MPSSASLDYFPRNTWPWFCSLKLTLQISATKWVFWPSMVIQTWNPGHSRDQGSKVICVMPVLFTEKVQSQNGQVRKKNHCLKVIIKINLKDQSDWKVLRGVCSSSKGQEFCTHSEQLTAVCNSSSRKSNFLLLSSNTYTCMDIHTHNTHTRARAHACTHMHRHKHMHTHRDIRSHTHSNSHTHARTFTLSLTHIHIVCKYPYAKIFILK